MDPMTQIDNRNPLTEKIQRTCAWLLFILVAATATASGRMEALTENQMDDVIAQSGIGMVIDGYQFDWTADWVTIYDTDSERSANPDAGTISFCPLRLINGRIETDRSISWDAYTIVDASHPMDGRTFTTLLAPDLDQDLSLLADNVYVCGQRIGEAGVVNFQTPEWYWTLGAHGSGVDFQYDVNLRMDRLLLAYNPSGAAGLFAVEGISITGGFADMNDFDIHDSATWDIPTDPSQWQRIGRFSIGDLDGGRPARLDVGASAIEMELPINGSIRAENLHFGAQDFGPLAIDNIRVHHLTLLIPGN
ncbi:hypothetical protein DSCA_19640 [Desulfosarcina alkanivorans]|uniref:Uncharacterized protein n=2 Tax=Desulfosarcina alkanivorans TaxID=571177 RepID=A0A5K7YNU7_9BACT|nr:hypothetical protein DSCA_19640 [Desulfosarcina alkanivorans]